MGKACLFLRRNRIFSVKKKYNLGYLEYLGYLGNLRLFVVCIEVPTLGVPPPNKHAFSPPTASASQPTTPQHISLTNC